VTNVDLAPTLVDYAGLEAPAKWQGRSLRPLIDGSASDWRDHVVFDHGLYTAQRAVRTDDWKLVRTYHPGMWETVVPEVALYDMDADPWEQTDVSDDNPDVVSELTERMVVWAERHRGRGEDSLLRVAREGPTGVGAYDDFDGV
jgi:arylsulfatase A-like enzyme